MVKQLTGTCPACDADLTYVEIDTGPNGLYAYNEADGYILKVVGESNDQPNFDDFPPLCPRCGAALHLPDNDINAFLAGRADAYEAV